MTELRRLLIDRHRLEKIINVDQPLLLLDKEYHYLKRVLRLHKGNLLAVVDGSGHLWKGIFQGSNEVHLLTPFEQPLQIFPRPNPLIGLAVVVPKRGFDEMLRMTTEIGVDIIQPLVSERCVFTTGSINRTQRWQSIVREAVEQSERLWEPRLLETIELKDFVSLSSSYPVGFAITRISKLRNCTVWLNEITSDVNQVWIAIGPEGGWTPEEEKLAIDSGCVPIDLGDAILRTSTAGIVASQNMAFSRSTW